MITKKQHWGCSSTSSKHIATREPCPKWKTKELIPTVSLGKREHVLWEKLLSPVMGPQGWQRVAASPPAIQGCCKGCSWWRSTEHHLNPGFQHHGSTFRSTVSEALEIVLLFWNFWNKSRQILSNKMWSDGWEKKKKNSTGKGRVSKNTSLCSSIVVWCGVHCSNLIHRFFPTLPTTFIQDTHCHSIATSLRD